MRIPEPLIMLRMLGPLCFKSVGFKLILDILALDRFLNVFLQRIPSFFLLLIEGVASPYMTLHTILTPFFLLANIKLE